MKTRQTETKHTAERVPLVELPERIPYAERLIGKNARNVYDGVAELSQRFKDSPYFTKERVWQFNEKTGEIEGSNLGYVILANDFLRGQGKRTLTFDEGMELDRQKKFSNDVYRDFGIVIYSAGEPNSELVEQLIKKAEARGLGLPLLAHPYSLAFDEKSNVVFAEDDSLIIHGERALAELEKFTFRGKSGVLRLGRGRVGAWGVIWGGLAGSGADGRVDWVRAEGTRADFEAEALREIEEAYNEGVKKYFADLEGRRERAFEALRGK